MSAQNGSSNAESGVENLSKTLAEKVTIASDTPTDDQKEELTPG